MSRGGLEALGALGFVQVIYQSEVEVESVGAM